MQEITVEKTESIPPYDVGSINDLSPGQETLSRLGQFLQDRFKKLSTLFENSDFQKEKQNAFNVYHMVTRARPLPYAGAANFTCPLPRIGVDSFHANVMASVFAQGNKISLRPSLINKEMASIAKKATYYMESVLNHECDFYNVFDDADRKSHMFGVAYLEPYYEKEEVWETSEVKETKRVPVVDPLTQKVSFQEKTTTKREKKKKTIFDGTRVRSLPVDSIFRSPFLSFEEALRNDCVIKVFQMKYERLKEGSKTRDERPTYFKRSEVAKISKSIVEKVRRVPNDLEQARADLDGFWIDQVQDDEMVEMAEGYLWYDIDGDDTKEQIRVTFHPATGAVVRVVLGKCRIVDFNPRPVDGRGYGEGIPHILERLADEWENFHNSRSNAGQWENTTFGFYRAGGRFNPQQITIQPGHFYPVDDPREVQFANVPRVGTSYFQEEMLIQTYFEKLLALDENFQGVSARKKQTATETMTASSKASIRFGNPFNRIVTQLNKLLSHIWDLNRECAPEDKEFYILGEAGTPIFEKMSRGDYSDKFKFEIEVQSVFDKQMARDTWMLAYRLFISNPFFMQHPEKLWEVTQKTADNLNLEIDIPKPIQAKTTSPWEKIDIIKNGGDVEPELGEDMDYNLKIIERQLQADDIKDWDDDAIRKLIVLRDKCMIQKRTLEMTQLNQSGQFTGGPMAKQPPVTSNRNPTQMFNTMKVGEGQNSAKKNLKNGQAQQPQQGGQNVPPNLDAVTGPI